MLVVVQIYLVEGKKQLAGLKVTFHAHWKVLGAIPVLQKAYGEEHEENFAYALDYLSPKYLNKTLPELARVSAEGVVIFTGLPGQQRAKVAQLSKFGRPAKMRSPSWWVRFFVQTSLEENEAAIKKFEQAASKTSYKPTCQVFHLKSYH
ncbi:S-adenosyl-L-methionine-dependent methyltransferase [Quillaja saponaria]|uniref:S-adenosyl-L-methionine-dependent methyltransferase n=1 Tax=Quillaja saponaria TaxID=32244 RepID=A0AAD7PF85_QUISA|nr:S-adenosyl-L-methionine-dependent methyltransferase [Quillaja saponaria]